MREMAPIDEMAPGCEKKYNKEIFLKPVRTPCHLTNDDGVCRRCWWTRYYVGTSVCVVVS